MCRKFTSRFNMVFNISLDAIINKWKKLRQQHKQHHDKQKRSGTERQKKWKFFDEMDQACGHRDTSSPACLIDSSAPAESTGLFHHHHHHHHVRQSLQPEVTSSFTKINKILICNADRSGSSVCYCLTNFY